VTRSHRLEIVLVLAIVVITAVYVRYLYIPPFSERQVAAAEEKYDYDVGDPGPWFSAWSVGDGQAYAMIALDPRGQKLDEEIEETTYRFARAGYAWLASAFTLGQDDLVPYGLAVAGALAVVGVCIVAAILRPTLGPKAWLIVFNPALYIAFAGDTSETWAILLLAFGLGWGSWVASLALGVTSPTYLVALWGRWRLLVAGAASAVALAVYSFFAFGSESFVPGGGRIGFPLVSYFDHLNFWGMLLAGASLFTFWLGVRARDWTWVLASAFVLCFGWDVLRDPINAWRAAGFLPVLWAFGPGWVSPPRRQRALHPAEQAADVA
jgi:hypothetical protein